MIRLKVKIMSLDAGGKSIGIVNEKDALEIGIHPLDRVSLRKNSRRQTIIVDTTKTFVPAGTIAVYSEVKETMGLKNGNIVRAEPVDSMESKKYIKKKTEGNELNSYELRKIVDDVLERNLNDLELASFITAMYIHGLTMNENIALSRAMIATGKQLKFPGNVVDKHSIGGVPGDKTSILVVPIIASTGLVIPKTSSRSITSPAGTADRMEVLAPVNLRSDEMKKVVRKTGGCLVWGGYVDLAPADDLFIRVEHPLDLDPLLLPSVMSKKKSVGCRHLVIDIPVGPWNKIKNTEGAEKLAGNFKTLGRKLGIKVECAITRGDQPVGYAIGPALEAREALQTVMGTNTRDLVDKATSIAGLLLQMVGKGNKKTAEAIIRNGRAEEKLREIIKAQGGDPDVKPEDIAVGEYRFIVRSKIPGTLSSINNNALDNICRAAGTPNNKGAGLLLNKKVNDTVRKGDVLLTIYAEKKDKLRAAVELARSFQIFDVPGKRKMLVEKI